MVSFNASTARAPLGFGRLCLWQRSGPEHPNAFRATAHQVDRIAPSIQFVFAPHLGPAFISAR